MGCTSAKPKRTTSIEDVASKQPKNASQLPDKNGQVNKGPSGDKEKILREKPSSETNAIETPGAHKSFMAPDGIPFIDEDIEVDDVHLTDNQLANGKSSQNMRLGSPDQNKNIVLDKKEIKLSTANPVPSVTGARQSALEEIMPPSDSEHQKDTMNNEPTVVSQIKTQEVQISMTRNQQNEATAEVRSQTILSDRKTEEEVAATKIQAGVRGYLDRQKVKAIRGNMQRPTETDEMHDGGTHQNHGPEVTEHVVEEHIECHSDYPRDPKLDAAATKIQANYKGYRTRKEIKTSHSK